MLRSNLRILQFFNGWEKMSWQTYGNHGTMRALACCAVQVTNGILIGHVWTKQQQSNRALVACLVTCLEATLKTWVSMCTDLTALLTQENVKNGGNNGGGKIVHRLRFLNATGKKDNLIKVRPLTFQWKMLQPFCHSLWLCFPSLKIILIKIIPD